MAPHPGRRTSSTTPNRSTCSSSPGRWWRRAGSACRGCGYPGRGARGDAGLAAAAFPVGLPQPPLEPLAVERLYLDNYFSVAKATRDLGYRPLFTTEQAMAECLPYYTELFDQMKAAASPAPWPVVAAAVAE